MQLIVLSVEVFLLLLSLLLLSLLLLLLVAGCGGVVVGVLVLSVEDF